MEETIGPYRVEAEIGRGGMGVVYRAVDSRLDRVVAIKSLPEEFASDPLRLERFEREARVLAQVTHPNIAGIYGLEEKDGARYLVLEYVQGETLAEVLSRGALPVDDAIEIAAQIADGVAAAHDAGVIHRDLKPGNVIITPDGRAKVLDFGLARSDGVADASSAEMTQTPTATYGNSPTIPGAILGTAPYMSPEQARGKMVDKRTDIWSFGAMLYEMLTGIGPFHGETATESIGAILHKDVDLDALPAGTPAHVRRVLERCLERDKNARFRDIGDVRLELLSPREHREISTDVAVRRAGIPVGVALLAGLLLASAAGLAGWLAPRAAAPEAELAVRKFEIMHADRASEFDPKSARISPDGSRIAFIQGDAVRVRDLSTFDTVDIAELKDVKELAWSPDGRSIAYASSREMYRVSASGGGVSKLGDHGVSHQFAWADDNRILFSTNWDQVSDSILELSARGGMPSVLLDSGSEEALDFHAATTIPGTGVLLFVRHNLDHRTPIVAWDGERSVKLVDFDDLYYSNLAWSPSGHVLFTRGYGTIDLWAVPFSPERMGVTGEPFLVQPKSLGPSVSRDGTLSIVRGTVGRSSELFWIMPDGSTEVIGSGGDIVRSTIVSPDGTRVAYATGPSPQDMQVWVRDLERGISTRISSLKGFVLPSAWSPDGREIAVQNFDTTVSENKQRTYFLASDGSGPTREYCLGNLSSFDRDWTVATQIFDASRESVSIFAVDLSDMSTIGEVTSALNAFLWTSLNPEGTLMLYGSTESGEAQVYCTRFPSGEGRWQVSSEGGTEPFWSHDGTAAYYLNSDRELIRVSMTREPEIRFGLPEQVFETMPNMGGYAAIYQSPDGERFISSGNLSDEDEDAGLSLSLIEHWAEEFRSDEE